MRLLVAFGFATLLRSPPGAGLGGVVLTFIDHQAEAREVVKLRLKRFGRRHRPFYRLNAIDQRNPRDGKPIEQLGWYDPMQTDDSKQYEINDERAKYWLSVGAQPSETVTTLLRKAGILESKKS